MFFRQILHADLGCASYVLADGKVGAIVDPRWQVEEYLRLADENGFEIRHVLETHDHADHVSGRGRLVAATGAVHTRVPDGDAVQLGANVSILGLSTPGHRPEHSSFLVVDRRRDDEPWFVLTGDSLFVGDVARPDLAVDAEEGARGLFSSLRKLADLGDHLEVWPAHIGGSLCGGAGMSKKPSSTIGFERRFNRFLQIEEERRFVHELTTSTRPQPPNFERIVELNRRDPPERAVELVALAPARVEELVDGGATLIDGREPREFQSAHVPGALNVTMVKLGVGTRAAWVVEPESDVVVLAGADELARAMARLLEAVGFRRLRGYAAGGISAWLGSDKPVDSARSIDIPTLARRLKRDDVTLLDVRERSEWEKKHVEDSFHVPYHDLRDGLPKELEARKDEPVAVACSEGNRSSLAVSLLQRLGFENVLLVADGGIADLEDEGVPLVAGGS